MNVVQCGVGLAFWGIQVHDPLAWQFWANPSAVEKAYIKKAKKISWHLNFQLVDLNVLQTGLDG